MNNARLSTEIDDCRRIHGDSCPHRSPWSRRDPLMMSIPLALILIYGIVVLAATSLYGLFLWLCILGLRCFPKACARCPYYGQNCGMGMGRIAPMILPKKYGKSMKPVMWFDFMLAIVLFGLPLPFAWRFGGGNAIILWLLLAIFLMLFSGRFACGKCPFQFCPTGRLVRSLERFLEGPSC